MINLLKTTKYYKDWWNFRKIDWKKSYLDTWNHPHRDMIVWVLGSFRWNSLIEMGCGPGPNLVKIVKEFKNKQLGGVDINADAIKLANETIAGAYLKVGSVENSMMSDNSADVILTDMCLIYMDNSKIGKVLKELKRIGRSRIVLCEFHSESLFKRLKFKRKTGYNAYNYKKLLQRYGFYDIILKKIPEEAWPGGEPQKTFGYIITAKIPRK